MLLLVLQQLEPLPFPAEVGGTVTVRATGREGRPLPQLAIAVELPDGARAELGATDAAGAVTFVPTQPGTHVFAAEWQGVRLLSPDCVVPKQTRWLYALACVPLGLLLGWRHLLALRRTAPLRRGATSAPSPPGP